VVWFIIISGLVLEGGSEKPLSASLLKDPIWLPGGIGLAGADLIME
jgi:hypothetical protein